MSNSIEKVKPVIIEGVEFYVSANGKETGVSQIGLANLIGIGESGLRGFLSRALSGSGDLKLNEAELFNPRIEGLNSGTPAKIITSRAAMKILKHYARKGNQVAEFSYDKFAEMGFDSWVKESVGFIEKGDSEGTQRTLEMLFDRVEQLATGYEEYNNIRKATVSFYPGLDGMLDGLTTGLRLAPSRDLTTAKEWLSSQGIELTFSELCSFGRLVSDTYKSVTGRDPENKQHKVNGKMKSGKGYLTEHYPILEMCWQKFTAG